MKFATSKQSIIKKWLKQLWFRIISATQNSSKFENRTHFGKVNNPKHHIYIHTTYVENPGSFLFVLTKVHYFRAIFYALSWANLEPFPLHKISSNWTKSLFKCVIFIRFFCPISIKKLVGISATMCHSAEEIPAKEGFFSKRANMFK